MTPPERTAVAEADRVFELIRRRLQAGQSLEIEGLGTFRAAAGGGFEFTPRRQPRVFVAYVEEDLRQARKLAAGLRASRYAPWLDKEQLLAGQNWPRAIERAIEVSDFFIACFSTRSVSQRGQFQSELRYALDCARRLPLEDVFVIPVRLEECAVPRRVAQHLQYVDLFPDWDKGLQRAIRAMERRRRRRADLRLAG